jgi:hypothetical protein
MKIVMLAIILALLAVTVPALASDYAPMMDGLHGWETTAAFTVGETVDDYIPVGILDGTYAYEWDEDTIRVFVNHELGDSVGYPYTLGNGTELTGARISYFDFDKETRELQDAGPAIETVYDRHGNVVTDPIQINEGDVGTSNGFERFCSANGVQAGDYGFVDDIFFTNEETSAAYGHPHGGSYWALNVHSGDLWALPALGRGTWESLTPLETGTEDLVALLLGDDFEASPLYLYIGHKNAIGDGSFLDRNGLAVGQLYAWKSIRGDASPEDFNGTHKSSPGRFVPVEVRDPSMAGEPGYDDQGYLDDVALRALAVEEMGAFAFSRPEDLHTNPYDGTQAVMASTGRGSLFPSDNWGTVYLVDVRFNFQARSGLALQPMAKLTILHDADDYGDYGVRSADNLVWGFDGFIYVQEDRSTSPSSLFGAESGREASICQINPRTARFVRVAEMDRSAVAPAGSTDGDPDDIGDWESSGVLDVTPYFETERGEVLLLAVVQAHSIRDGVIADYDLVQGGQIFFLSK